MAELCRMKQTGPVTRPGDAEAVSGLDRTTLKGGRMATSTLTSTTSMRVGSPRAHESDPVVARAASGLREDRDRGLAARTPGGPPEPAPRGEPWVTKRELAAHLQVTPRWIELQHPQGLPHLRRGRILRYRISAVESWLLSSPTAGGA